MKISKPFRACTPQSLTQGFNSQHFANDFAGKYGEFLVAVCNSKVLSIVDATKIEETGEELSRGYGIRLQSIEYPGFSYTYWHCQSIFPVSVGEIVLQGKPVAMMGNSGFVMSGGVIVENKDKMKPPYLGTHVHWSCGTKIGDIYTASDPSKLIDWSIPVNYSVLATVMIILKKMLNFLKGRG